MAYCKIHILETYLSSTDIHQANQVVDSRKMKANQMHLTTV